MALGLLTTACSFNSATGRLQLTTVSESQEVELGRQTDAEVVEALGLYDDEQLTALVERVGAELASHSERPTLPWTFRVLDEPAVNAFALPGGYVYATRGLLVHLQSEHELAAVLGHEIGHVTARHGVVQLRKSRVAAASVGVFRIVDPNLRHVGGLAASTAGLALLKHSRDDEFEADTLGLRYAGKAGYAPGAAVAVFDVLVGVSRVEQSERVPNWLSTHPDPEQRRTRVQSMVSAKAPTPPELDEDYLAMLDGVLYGEDPRNGFIVGTTFVHPRQGFRLDLPPGWQAMHQGPRVMAISEDEQALMVLTPTEAESGPKALEDFFADGSMELGEQWKGQVGGFPVTSAGFSVTGSDGVLMGLIAFIDYGEEVMALAAMGPQKGWTERSPAVATTFASFHRAERGLARVEPMRVRTSALSADTTLAKVDEAHPSAIELSRLALLNAVDAEAVLAEGTVIKRVEGFNPRAVEPSTPSAPGTAP